MSELAPIEAAIREGRLDDAIASLEALADRGVVGSGVAYDRGLAYALRARSGAGLPGDYGRAAHGFEEALRRDPHDAAARRALEEVRREIARRDARATGKAEELASTPFGRAILVSLPGDAWAGLAIVGSIVLAVALAVRPRLPRGGRRLAASTIAVVALAITSVASALGVSASWLRRTSKEAVVVAPHAAAAPEGPGPSLDLDEGQRVDVIEERATTTKIRTDRGEGWAPRDALRMLPPYRP